MHKLRMGKQEVLERAFVLAPKECHRRACVISDQELRHFSNLAGWLVARSVAGFVAIVGC